jgi:hypothetical protein
MHVSTPLRDLSIGAASEDGDFVLELAAPFVDVEKQIDQYYEYPIGEWNRLEVQERGPSQKSREASYTLSTTPYECKRYAVKKGYDWSDKAEADAILDLDRDAADYLSNQMKLKGDQLFATEAMIAATWTTDFDGAAAKAYGSSEVLFWDDASGDPQEDHYYLSGQVKGLCGKTPNVMVVGWDVHTALVANAQVRDAIKHTSPAGGANIENFLASYFNVEQYIPGGAFYNSAAEGATDSIAFLIPSDSVWAGYVSKRKGARVFTATRTFAFRDDGRASKGVVTRQWQDEERTTTWNECEMFWDMKIISADAGYFIDDVLT